MEQESGLFQVRFNEQGKILLRKFVSISYLIMGLVVFTSCIEIYWSTKYIILRRTLSGSFPNYRTSLYEKLYPYISIFFNVLIVYSNIYYIRFPRVLLKSVEENNETAANQSFQILLKGGWIFLFWLVLEVGRMIWELLSR